MEEHIKQAKHQIQLCDIVEPLLEWYRKNARRLPWRENTDPYRVWVSEIMLQQTRVEAVKPYFERFLKQLPTLKDLAAADEDTLLKLWEGLGYYARVRNLQKAAQTICKEYGGIFPETYEDPRAPGNWPVYRRCNFVNFIRETGAGNRWKRTARHYPSKRRSPGSLRSGLEKADCHRACRGISCRAMRRFYAKSHGARSNRLYA